jgi:hypothetical protein
VSTFTFDDLLVWSERLPDWQRDALRRILININLTDSDVSELATLAKTAQGIPMPAGITLSDPATSGHIRASGASAPTVALVALRDITYVNALAPGPVTFAPDGLTVVYGENASGKSSIARILKKAGRSRSPGGLIWPSVFEADPREPARATIEFRVGTVARSFRWDRWRPHRRGIDQNQCI